MTPATSPSRRASFRTYARSAAAARSSTGEAASVARTGPVAAVLDRVRGSGRSERTASARSGAVRVSRGRRARARTRFLFGMG